MAISLDDSSQAVLVRGSRCNPASSLLGQCAGTFPQEVLHLHVPGLDELVAPSRPWIGRVGTVRYPRWSTWACQATEDSVSLALPSMLPLILH